MRRAAFVAIWGVLPVWAQVAAARIGCVRDDANRLRPLFGIAGNFILGPPEASSAGPAACSGRLTALSTGSSLELLEEGRVIAEWPAPDAQLLALALDSDGKIHVIVARSGRMALKTIGPGEEQERELGAVESPILWVAGRLVVAQGAELLIKETAGPERRLPLPAPVTALEQLGEKWITLRLAGSAGRLALRLDQDAPYRLPEAMQ